MLLYEIAIVDTRALALFDIIVECFDKVTNSITYKLLFSNVVLTPCFFPKLFPKKWVNAKAKQSKHIETSQWQDSNKISWGKPK